MTGFLLFAALGAGLIVGFLLAKRGQSIAEGKLAACESDLLAAREELVAERAYNIKLVEKSAGLEAKLERIAMLEEELGRRQEEEKELVSELRTKTVELVAASKENERILREAQLEKKHLETMNSEMQKELKAFTVRNLEDNRKQFAKLGGETIENLLAPLKTKNQ